MDWIRARLDCSIDHAWIALREAVKEDVDRWKALQHGSAWRVTLTSEESSVLISGKSPLHGGSNGWARLSKGEGVILLKKEYADTETISIKLIPSLNAKGECRLLREGEELEFWQVSRLAIESLLF